MSEESQMKTRSLARVASVIEMGNEVVINRGSDDGVKSGDRYLIYGLGEELIDPETGESLGQLELVRGRGVVVHVQSKMSTLRSVETRVRKRTHNSLSTAFAAWIDESPEQLPFNGAATGDYAKPV